MKKLRKTKKLLTITAVIMMSLMVFFPETTQAAGKTKLNSTKKTINVGDSCTVKLLNNTKKVKWSASNKNIKIVSKSKKQAKIKGIKKGTSYLKAKVGSKTYKCKVAVKEKKNKNATLGEQNALKKAKMYLEVMPFSYIGLIKQLEYEGYTNKEAVYGADNCGADWFEQAAKKAKIYLEMMPFSKEGLIAQLEYEGFTHEQAVYGAKKNGY